MMVVVTVTVVGEAVPRTQRRLGRRLLAGLHIGVLAAQSRVGRVVLQAVVSGGGGGSRVQGGAARWGAPLLGTVLVNVGVAGGARQGHAVLAR